MRRRRRLAHVVVDDSGMMLVNQDGMDQYAQGRPVEPAQLERLTNDLEHLAKVATLRGLVSGTADEALEIPTAFTVHATPNGPALESGSTLPQGVVYLRAHHLGKPSDPPVFANIVNIGQVGDVCVLSGESSPTGIVLTAQQTVQLDGDVGTELYWPEELPKDEPRPETFFAVFSDAELDIRSIASAGIAVRSAAKGNTDRSGTLQHVVDLAASGTSRSARRPAAGEPPIRYHVHHFEFLLDPGFQVDESAALAGGAARRRDTGERCGPTVGLRGATQPAGHVLDRHPSRRRVHHRRWFGQRNSSGDANLDVSRGSPTAIGCRRTNWCLYSGPVQDFLEMAIWVSRANQANPNLAELIGMSLQNQTPTSSTGGLLPLVADADRFAVTEGINAVGTVVEAVGRILRQAVNRSIGLYRTTLLVPEDLTPGRRPTEGFRKTQDMNFAYDIVVQD